MIHGVHLDAIRPIQTFIQTYPDPLERPEMTSMTEPFPIKFLTFGTIARCQLDIALPIQPSNVISKPPQFIAHHYASSDYRRLRFSSLTLSALQVTI